MNSTKHLKHNKYYSFLNSYKKIEEGGTLPNMLWSHHYPDNKTRQGCHQKKKNLQANTPDEYRDKNPQQILANKIQ